MAVAAVRQVGLGDAPTPDDPEYVARFRALLAQADRAAYDLANEEEDEMLPPTTEDVEAVKAAIMNATTLDGIDAALAETCATPLWDKPSVWTAIYDWTLKHGRFPTARGWNNREAGRPSYADVRKAYHPAGWVEALADVGYPTDTQSDRVTVTPDGAVAIDGAEWGRLRPCPSAPPSSPLEWIPPADWNGTILPTATEPETEETGPGDPASFSMLAERVARAMAALAVVQAEYEEAVALFTQHEVIERLVDDGLLGPGASG